MEYLPLIIIAVVLSFVGFFIGLALYRNRIILHFQLLDVESKPLANINVYGISMETGHSFSQTTGGDYVSVPNGSVTESLKKIGQTDANGEFKANYWMTSYAFIAFNLNNQYNLPNQFLTEDLNLPTQDASKKIIRRKSNGNLVLTNPNKRQQIRVRGLE